MDGLVEWPCANPDPSPAAVDEIYRTVR